MSDRRHLVLAVAAIVHGCGGDEAGAGVACPSGEALVDGACTPAPLSPDQPCPPGEWLREADGACGPAGVPPDGCAEGFVHDGDGGCDPILPAEACPPGLMAIPGETSCREVAPCGDGPWGDIPVEPDTVYVDQAFIGESDGSAEAPFTTIQEAIDAAPHGAIVAVAAGSYEDVLIVGRPRRLWGRCPALVEIVAAPGGFAAIRVRNHASDTEVHRVAVTGANIGVDLFGSQRVLLEEIWAHDNGWRGINAEEAYLASDMTVRGSLIEKSHEVGIVVTGSTAVVEATVVRDTLPESGSSRAPGIVVQLNPATSTVGSLQLRQSLLERNRELGLLVSSATATVDATVIRDQGKEPAGALGAGVLAQIGNLVQTRTRLELRRSVIVDNVVTAVTLFGSDGVLDAVTLRRTAPGPLARGWGVGVQEDPVSGQRGTLHVSRSLLADNALVGLFVSGSDAVIEGTVVRDTIPLTQGVAGTTSRLGRAVTIQRADGSLGAPAVTLRASVLERSVESALLLVGPGSATVDNCVVRDTRPTAGGTFGDGLIAWSYDGVANLVIGASRIEQSARAAVANFGGSVTIASSLLVCQSFDLNAESWGDLAGTFEDDGGVLCGCPEAAAACHAQSAALEPPPAP